MQSIIVEVYVPASSATFDFRIPSTGQISDIVREMMSILEATQKNLFFDRKQPMLCDRGRSRVLSMQDTVAETGLQDGARLMLL